MLRWLICTFVVRIGQKQVFSWQSSIISSDNSQKPVEPSETDQKPAEHEPKPSEAVVAVVQEPAGELTVKEEPVLNGSQTGDEIQVSAWTAGIGLEYQTQLF